VQTIPILAPAAVLVLWSLIILGWLTLTRFPAFSKVGIRLGESAPGTRYVEVESMMPAKVNWKSHNYTHLMEQPTIFYAAVIILALAGAGDGINLWLAWGYVGLRVVHSIWQCTINLVPVRVGLFTLSTFCLLGLAINALRMTL
jgi:hypothetical protein